MTHHIEQWRQAYLPSISQQGLHQASQITFTFLQKQFHLALRYLLNPKQLVELVLHPAALQQRFGRRHYQPPIVLLIAVLSLTSFIGYRFYNEPLLAVGTIAPQTLRAPESASVVDKRTTQETRLAAKTAAVPVLMLDPTINQEVTQSLQSLLQQGDTLRAQAGPFPFVDNTTLSTKAQRYLRQAQEWEWREAIARAKGELPDEGYLSYPSPAQPAAANSTRPDAPDDSDPLAASQSLAILELQNYTRLYSSEGLTALERIITQARQRYRQAITALQTPLANATKRQPNAFYHASLLNLEEDQWETSKTIMQQALNRMLSQGVSPGLPNTLMVNAIQVQLGDDLSPETEAQAIAILKQVIRPNLVEDPVRTQQRAQQAAESIADVMVEIRKGEVIVQAGKPITQEDFVLLDHFGLSRRRVNWLGLLGFSGLVGGGIAIFLLVEQRFHTGLRRRDRLLILLLTLSAPVMIALGLQATSLPLIGLLVGSFYGSALGVTVLGLLTVLLPIGMEVSLTHLLASAMGSILGAIMAERLRSREELALLGGGVGLTQGLVYLVLTLILSSSTRSVWYILLLTAALQTLIGITWSVVALGISPYLEQFFDLVTPIRLAELSNPNRPLLERLSSTTPGTFQHTLFVSTLAEAAARALSCNVELVRAGTLYHDIGKMHDPLAFIENQMGGPNKHDEIDDPWASAALIKKHVSEGLVMARRCRLPKAIQTFIPEHQGTMLISYFYYQALQQAKTDPTLIVNEADFRYDGPIPQTRETGIVMLADSCEAALRSLKDATPEEALAMVNRILRARWQDNQLSESGLSREEMTRIADIFVQVWLQFNHQRIPYPKAALGGRN